MEKNHKHIWDPCFYTYISLYILWKPAITTIIIIIIILLLLLLLLYYYHYYYYYYKLHYFQFPYIISGLKKHSINPANTQRNEHMIITSKRRFDV